MASFGLSLIGGIAEGAEKNIRRDLDLTEQRISDLAKIRAETVARESGKHATKFSSTKDSIRGMASLVDNDMDIVQYVLDTEGSLEGAQAKLQEISSAVKLNRYSAYELLGLQKRQGANVKITAAQMANTLVPEYKVPPIDEEYLAVGTANLFRGPITQNIENLSNQYMNVSGVNRKRSDVGVIGEYPSVLDSSGEKDWYFNMTGDPTKDAAYTKRGYNEAMMEYHKSVAEGNPKKELFILAQELFAESKIQDSSLDIINAKIPEPLDPIAVTNLQKSIGLKLSKILGVETMTPFGSKDDFLTTQRSGMPAEENKPLKTRQTSIIMQKADKIVAEVEANFRSPNDNNLTAENMTSAQVYEEIFELIRQNKQYEVFLTPGEEYNDKPIIGVRQLERTYSTETAVEQLRSSDYSFEFMSKDELANFKNNAMNISTQKDDFFQSQEYMDLVGFDDDTSVLDVISANNNNNNVISGNDNKVISGIDDSKLKTGNIMEAYNGFSFPDATKNDYASFMEANPNALREDWLESFRARFTDAMSQKTSDERLFKLIPKLTNNTTSTKSNQNFYTNVFGQKVYNEPLTIPIDSNEIDTTKKIEIGSAGFTTSAKITNVTRAKNGAVNYEIEYKNNLGKTETKMISATGKTGMSFNFDYEKYIEENE
mgnify:FL=1|tara:strand:- start:2150 stop:4120 length:1971 start_codon:yes stop_codon:yes gene_type:complete